jgi:hypothetical protein
MDEMKYIHSMNWHEHFELDEVTGTLTWRIRPRSHFANDRGWNVFNGRYAGNVAGKICRDSDGYTCIELVVSTVGLRRSYKAHRVIWEMLNGPIPDGWEIDHVDGNSLHNTPSNLRLATRYGNASNVGRRKDNTSGYKGVHKTAAGKFIARIQSGKVRTPLGSFNTAEEAHMAYKQASVVAHRQFAKAA